MPKTETPVDYYPWFLDQVESDNIKKLSIQGNRGPRRAAQEKTYQSAGRRRSVKVQRFITYFPSEQSIDPVIGKLREHASKTRRPGRGSRSTRRQLGQRPGRG